MKVLILLCLALVISQSNAIYTFNALTNDLCDNGGAIDWVTGKCDCTGVAAFTGYKCHVPEPVTACALSCGSGVCHNDGTSDACYCDEGYEPDPTSGLCVGIVRVSDCTTAGGVNFIVNIYPNTAAWTGYISLGQPAVTGTPAACYLAGTGWSYTLTGVALSPTPDVTCQTDLVADTTTDPGNELYSYNIYIQPDPTSTAGIQTIPVQCKIVVGGASPGSPGTPVSPVGTDPANVPVYTSVTDADTGITIEIQDPTGAVITTAQDIGADAQVVVKLDTTKGFSMFRLEKLSAMSGDESESSDFVLLSCPLRSALLFMTGMSSTSAPAVKSVKVPFKVFKFLTSTAIKFRAEATLCDATAEAAGTCAALACDAATDVPAEHPDFAEDGIGRRRRRQTDSTGKSTTLDVTLYAIPESTYSLGRKNVMAPRDTACYNNMVFLVPLIILAIVLFIAVVMGIYFCLKVTRTSAKN